MLSGSCSVVLVVEVFAELLVSSRLYPNQALRQILGEPRSYHLVLDEVLEGLTTMITSLDSIKQEGEYAQHGAPLLQVVSLDS